MQLLSMPKINKKKNVISVKRNATNTMEIKEMEKRKEKIMKGGLQTWIAKYESRA